MKLRAGSEELYIILDLLPRLDNWRNCYGDRSRKEVSITEVACRALKMYGKFPLPDEPTTTDRPYQIDKDDADLLQYVWEQLPHENINFLPVRTLITLIVFKRRREEERWSRLNYKTVRGYSRIRWQALLIFANRVRIEENRRMLQANKKGV